MIAVCLHGVCGQFYVIEHALQFDRELGATFDLELGKHASFHIIRYRLVVKESFRQVGPIISFEYVFFCEEPEQGKGFIESELDFSIGFLEMAVR
jgi:hypothetical protein